MMNATLQGLPGASPSPMHARTVTAWTENVGWFCIPTRALNSRLKPIPGLGRGIGKSSRVTTRKELCSSTPGRSWCQANVRLQVTNTVTVLGVMFSPTSRGLGGQRSQGWWPGPCGGTHLATVDEKQYRASSHNGNTIGFSYVSIGTAFRTWYITFHLLYPPCKPLCISAENLSSL